MELGLLSKIIEIVLIIAVLLHTTSVYRTRSLSTNTI